jgi:hypothetical protein
VTQGASVTVTQGASVTVTPNRLLIKTINKNNNSLVVVNGITEENKQMDELVELGMGKKRAVEIIKGHSITRIAEAILDSKNPSVKNRAGYIVYFLTSGRSLREGAKSFQPKANPDAEKSRKIIELIDQQASKPRNTELAVQALAKLRGKK